MKFIVASIVLGFTALSVWLLLFKTINNQSYILAEDISYEIGSGVSSPWYKMCISTEYTWPNTAISELNNSTCLRNVEVPEFEVFLIYLMNDGSCQTRRVRGSFLFKSNSETRCFARKEVDGDHLTTENKIIKFGDKNGK